MSKFADLHIHTIYSDSTASPEDVVRDAIQQQLSCVAVTDHDTFEGVWPTQKAALEHSLEVIAGIELSTEIAGKDIHILGYFFEVISGGLTEQIKNYQVTRIERMREMVKRLIQQGVGGITEDEVLNSNSSEAIGRPHLASILVEKGIVKSFPEAFKKYLGEDCPAYVPKFKQSPTEAIRLIRNAGGAAVLAHPMITSRDELIPKLVEDGLAGLEVYYPNCFENTTRFYEKLAKKHGLIATGGSDAHGVVKSYTHIGKAKVDYSVIELLKGRAKKG